MRHIEKTVNLTHFKSFIESLIPAAKEREPVDIRQKKQQERLNTTSNYAMCPYITKVIINYNDGHIIKYWSWQTLHEIYIFFKNNYNVCIENIETTDFNIWFGVDIDFFMLNYETLKEFVIDYVITGKESDDTDPDLINFHLIDDLELNECVDFIDYFPCYKENREDPEGIYAQKFKEDELENKEPLYRTDLEHVDDLQCYANISLPLYISNKIDNVGLMENLPDEWQEQTSYTVGNLVFYENNDWYLNKNKATNPNVYEKSEHGYTWDSVFKESLFGNLYYNRTEEGYMELSDPQWIRNIEHEMKGRHVLLNEGREFALSGKDFSSFVGESYFVGDLVEYAYKGMEFVLDPNYESMGDKYEMTNIDGKIYIIYNNVLTEIKDYDIVKYFNCELGYYEVYHECGNQYHYLLYNGERIYGYEENGAYHFQYYGVTYSSEKINGLYIDSVFVETNTENYKENDEYISKISNVRYKVLPDTSCVVVNGNWYIEKEGKLYEYIGMGAEDEESNETIYQVSNEETTNLGIYLDPEKNKDVDGKTLCYRIESGILYIVNPYMKYSFNYISGTTESKLGLFRASDFLYDELGNSIRGMVLPDTKENAIVYKTTNCGVLRPQPYRSLSLNYIKNTTKNVRVVDYESNRAIGDILREIEFFVPLNGEMINVAEKLKSVPEFNQLTTSEQLDEIYNKLDITYNEEDGKFELVEVEGINNFNETLNAYNTSLKCKFTYNLGAFLIFDRETGDYSLDETAHKGVEYTEVYTVIRLSNLYHRSINDVYTVYTYDLVPDKTSISDDESEELVFLADFTMEIPIYRLSGNKSEIYDVKNHFGNGYDKLDRYKNFISAPLIHRNYNNGVVSQEKVDGNIYIDRGISSTFEKHLKLQEVATMDDLETYSNGGFFNITNDNAY